MHFSAVGKSNSTVVKAKNRFILSWHENDSTANKCLRLRLNCTRSLSDQIQKCCRSAMHLR